MPPIKSFPRCTPLTAPHSAYSTPSTSNMETEYVSPALRSAASPADVRARTALQSSRADSSRHSPSSSRPSTRAPGAGSSSTRCRTSARTTRARSASGAGGSRRASTRSSSQVRPRLPRALLFLCRSADRCFTRVFAFARLQTALKAEYPGVMGTDDATAQAEIEVFRRKWIYY